MSSLPCKMGSLWGSLLLSLLSAFSCLRLLSHRMTIRQISSSVSSLHVRTYPACGASPVFTTTPFPRLYRCLPNPSCKIQRPARSASLPPQHPPLLSRPNTHAHSFASRLSPIAFILLFTLSSDNVMNQFGCLRGIPAVLFLVCGCVRCL